MRREERPGMRRWVQTAVLVALAALVLPAVAALASGEGPDA